MNHSFGCLKSEFVLYEITIVDEIPVLGATKTLVFVRRWLVDNELRAKRRKAHRENRAEVLVAGPRLDAPVDC